MELYKAIVNFNREVCYLLHGYEYELFHLRIQIIKKKKNLQ